MPERRPAEPRCPICGKPVADELRPFCSRRCADVDLGRWLTGQYRIQAVPDEGEQDDEPA